MRDLRKAGVASETVARMVRGGEIQRIARGVYQHSNSIPHPKRSLAEASARVPNGVICLTTALQFHELTLRISPSVWMAIDCARWKPVEPNLPIRFVRFGSPSLETGVTKHLIDGIEVPIFEPAKTIVDCFRFRNKVGLDVALEGLREGLRSKRATADQISKLAHAARAWTVMRPYVEATVADDA